MWEKLVTTALITISYLISIVSALFVVLCVLDMTFHLGWNYPFPVILFPLFMFVASAQARKLLWKWRKNLVK
jgi:hypothetical protein